MTALSVIVLVLVFAVILVAWCVQALEDYPPSTVAGSILSGREEALIRAIADAFFPAGGPIPISGTAAGIPAYFNGYLVRSATTQRFMIRLLIAYLELSPLVFGPRRARFTRLSFEERLVGLGESSTSRYYFRRVCFISMRALMTMGYLANSEVARHMRIELCADPFGFGDRVFERDPREMKQTGDPHELGAANEPRSQDEPRSLGEPRSQDEPRSLGEPGTSTALLQVPA
ncbi:MAG: hypothetical protein EXR75_14255 [Myxococcales bacterium]|nr:hypothetical protein [Myxococcales bacterium]